MCGALTNQKMGLIFVLLLASVAAEDSMDYDFSEPNELLVAQESRNVESVVTPSVTIIKPTGVTNSHRPQYNLDSLEWDDAFQEQPDGRNGMKNYKQTRRERDGILRDAVLRALDRNQFGRFSQVLPIIRTMSGSQRVALASLVANQIASQPRSQPMSPSQVRSLFGNDTISDQMLPLFLDTANMVRNILTHEKENKEAEQAKLQMQRRSMTVATLDLDPFEKLQDSNETLLKQMLQRNLNFRNRQPSTYIKTTLTTIKPNTTDVNTETDENTIDTRDTNLYTAEDDDGESNDMDRNTTRAAQQTNKHPKSMDPSAETFNITLDLAVEATNQSISEEVPIAEKLRSLNRYLDRKGLHIRRGTYPPKAQPPRRAADPAHVPPVIKRPIPPVRRIPAIDNSKCEMFGNSLCLFTADYPTEAIMQSIRRNKESGTLLADYKEEGSIDGVSAAQETMYTAEHYLLSNRRGDTTNRDFAGAGEAGFMCPSTVKYARPQRARATSGQWKYIVNTGEHTQTLRLEKCLKPKESCTYLTDNFKSKCVQVYNYHRLLTWDMQNGLHMDIFKVPTCCSCHIEGYSVAFPPLGNRVQDTSSTENFPGEDLSSEQFNQAIESAQATMQKPSVESILPYVDKHNLISGSSLNNPKLLGRNEPTNLVDSYGNIFFQHAQNQAFPKKIRKPATRTPFGNTASDSVTLPSYLEPPTPQSPTPFVFSKDINNKFKINDYQIHRGLFRPSRRPMKKKTFSSPDDLISSGSTSVGTYSDRSPESLEDFPDDSEQDENENIQKKVTIAPKLLSVTTSSEILNTNVKQDLKKKINYNYHPIIDFFEDEEDGDLIDRDDSIESNVRTPESSWKPIV